MMRKIYYSLMIALASTMIHADDKLSLDTEVNMELKSEFAPFVDVSMIDSQKFIDACDEIDAACEKGGVVSCLRLFVRVARSYETKSAGMPKIMPLGLVTYSLDLFKRSGEAANFVALAEVMTTIVKNKKVVDSASVKELAQRYPVYVAYLVQMLDRSANVIA
ncbi:MAG TPA: hypothetical protein QGF02_04835 [Candidatus Babeliales bacterium]|nr:hypothetical protein [Candidatus Babeliales bacterium]